MLLDEQQDPWAAFNPQPLTTAAPGFTGVIPGAPPKPKEPSIPSGYEPDPEHPGRLRPIPGGPNDSSPPPGTGTSDLSGDSYLHTLDAPTAAMVKALAEGRKSFPSGAALRSPYWQEMLTHVSNYDPGFDETTYTSRAATRKDFNVGTAGKNIRALNTAIGHLGHLYDQADDTASHGFVPLNYLENAGRQMFGDSGPTNYASTTSALAGELTAVYRGAGGAEADIKRYIDELSPNASAAQKKDTIRNIASLLNSRLDALQDQYRKGMGVGANMQFLDQNAQNVLKELGALPRGNPPAGGSGGSGGPGGGGGGGDGPPGTSLLNADQSQAYKAFLAANPRPSGEQVSSFLSHLTGKTVTNGDEIAAAIAKGQGVNTTVENLTEKQRISDKADAMMRDGGGAGSAAIAGAGDTLSMGLLDEAGAGVTALHDSLTGHGSFADNYSTDVGANRLYQQRLRGEHPWAYTGGQIAGGVLLPTGEVTSALDAAKLGAAYGGAYGFGSGDNGVGSRIYGGALGAVTGGAAGAGGHAAVSALAPIIAPVVNKVLPIARRDPLGMAPDFANAAQAEGVDLIRPMVDPASRGKFGELEANPASQSTIRAGVNKVKGQIADRVNALGGDGTPLEPDAAGERIQTAARQFIQRSKGVADRLYNRARAIAGDTRFVPQNAINTVDQSISELSANPTTNAAEIKFLQGVKADLSTPGGKSIEELRQLRQSLRGTINEKGLTATQAEARAIGVLDAAQQDAAANLPKGAADAFRRADAFYRERMVHVDDILQRFLGGNVEKGQALLSGEQAFKRLKNMMAPGGDARRLAALMRDLEPSERQDITATIATSLGRRSADEPFSADRFITQTNNLTPQARRTLFGTDGAQSIQNLRVLSQALKDAGGDVNYTKSGSNVIRYMAKNFVGKITGLGAAGVAGFEAAGVHGAIGGATAAAGASAVGAGLKVMSAKAMLNPRVSRWLAQAADVSTPSQAKAAVNSLRLVISREPALAHELLPIHQFLDQRVTELLAAQPSGDDQKN